MDIQDFKKQAYSIVDWIADYFENIENLPVKSQVNPGDIFNKIFEKPPLNGENFDEIFNDFKDIILPGITHWQNPNFFSYFPANNSFPSILGEMLTAALGAQCMLWQTSPAAAELEESVMNWLREMLGLPDYLHGVIQDTASTATLCSILTAREKYSDYNINRQGFSDNSFTVYCSGEAHSSIDKAVKIAGIGIENLRKIPVSDDFAMLPNKLEWAIKNDLNIGKTPLCVIAAFGTTGSTAVDPIREIGEICSKYNIWLHVDAAYAGTALILPEMRHLLDGIEYADTFVFNPHKWMFTNFDCSAYFVNDKETLIRTFEIMPEYLKTRHDAHVNNYRDWGIQLGRRFRALKLWFVIRSFGVAGLQEKIRNHIKLASLFAKYIENSKNFELLVPPLFSTVCFRFKPRDISDDKILDVLNERLLNKLNDTGKIFLTHTKLKGKYTIRFQCSQTNVEERHVEKAWEIIGNEANKLSKF